MFGVCICLCACVCMCVMWGDKCICMMCVWYMCVGDVCVCVCRVYVHMYVWWFACVCRCTGLCIQNLGEDVNIFCSMPPCLNHLRGASHWLDLEPASSLLFLFNTRVISKYKATPDFLPGCYDLNVDSHAYWASTLTHWVISVVFVLWFGLNNGKIYHLKSLLLSIILLYCIALC